MRLLARFNLYSVALSLAFVMSACAAPPPLGLSGTSEPLPGTSQVSTIVSPGTRVTVTSTRTQAPTQAPTSAASTTSTTTTQQASILVVQDGAMLERDIIPQLMQLYNLDEVEVKQALAGAPAGKLISTLAEGFRRMEGIIPVGEDRLEFPTNLAQQVAAWVKAADERYDALLAKVPQDQRNSFSPAEQLILASIIEAECLADAGETQVAAVLFNRLRDKTKLQTCVTAEYAIGYQRAFLLYDDMEVEDPYNTYHVKGLPPGPIASVDDKSFTAALRISADEELYFYLYDYVVNKLFFYSDYDVFRADANGAQGRYEEEFGESPYSKVNKQERFGS